MTVKIKTFSRALNKPLRQVFTINRWKIIKIHKYKHIKNRLMYPAKTLSLKCLYHKFQGNKK